MLRNGKKRRSRRSEYRVRLDDEDRRQLALDFLAELQTQRQRSLQTFGDLCQEWLSRLRRVGGTGNERRHVECLKSLHGLREGELTSSLIETAMLRVVEARGLGPASWNKIRSTGKLVVDAAQSDGRWSSFNPFSRVKRRRVPRKPYTRLTLEELERAFLKLRPAQRRMARVSLFTGMRPGEVFSITKADVELERGFLNVHRSHERDETKTGKPRMVPIPAAVVEDLRAAIAASPSELVFPAADGGRQRRDTKLARMLRHALRLAGICSSWRYACRKAGCGFKAERPERLPHWPCPRCSWILHCIGVPQHFTYYDLRHAASTLHREAGADALAVKIALGHAPRDVNESTYTHLSDAKLRKELDRLGDAKPPQ